MSTRQACEALVSVGLLLFLALAAPAAYANEAPATAPCAAAPEDLTALLAPAASALVDAPIEASTLRTTGATQSLEELLAKPIRGYCRCGCGARCTTDADCGGGTGSCVAFISCC
jgi:hypothetical protein